jgi:flagellar basal-body rod protein FlgC
MGINQAMDISVSGIEAERRTMELISSNIANINTTRTVYGGPYRRKIAVLAEKPLDFSSELTAAEARLAAKAGGVEVVDVAEDATPFQKVYRPSHPDADAQGYVSMPNVSLADEMVDMTYVSQLYNANITAFNAAKKMAQDTLSIQ